MTAQLAQSLFYAIIFWMGLSLGCLFLTILHNKVNAKWGKATLRILEAGNKTLVVTGLLMLIFVLVCGKQIYPWMSHELAAEKGKLVLHAVEKKAWYLNMPRFMVMFALYFAMWGLWASRLNGFSRKQDETGDPKYQQARANWGAVGIVMFVVTITFAFTDWVMTIDPTWLSTIYGAWFGIGQALLALSFTVIYVIGNSKKPPFDALVTPQLTRDLGNLMLAFTMIWAYFSLSQYLIIWSGNLPEEIGYYITRAKNGWDFVGLLLIVGQFFLPFLCLLSGKTKRTPSMLFKLAIWVVIMRIVDNYYVIAPTFGGPVFNPRLPMDAIALAVVGVIWFLSFKFFLSQNTLVAKHDLVLQEALDHA